MPKQLKFDEIDTAEHGDWIEYYSGGLVFYDGELSLKLLHHKVQYTNAELLTKVWMRRWFECYTNVVTHDTYDGSIYSTDTLSERLTYNCFKTLEQLVEHALQDIEKHKEEELACWDRIVFELKSISKGGSANE